jgi:hypothetical protein
MSATRASLTAREARALPENSDRIVIFCLTTCDECADAGAMKLLEFKSGKDGASEFISPEAVAWVHMDAMPQKGGGFLTVIGTVDGKEHRVQGALVEVVAILAKQ